MKMQQIAQLFNSVATTEGKNTTPASQNKSISYSLFSRLLKIYGDKYKMSSLLLIKLYMGDKYKMASKG